MTGKDFEKLARPAFLEALKTHDPAARAGSLVEDCERGTDFLAKNVPMDLTINTAKPGTIIHEKSMPDIRDGTRGADLKFGIRTDNTVEEFAIPTVVITMSVWPGTKPDDFLNESMPSKWQALQANAIKYYSDITGYDPENEDQFYAREDTILNALDDDIAKGKEQKWMKKLGVKRTGVNIPDFSKPYFGEYEPDV